MQVLSLPFLLLGEKPYCDPDVIWTRNLLNWSQTRYRCATKPVVLWKNCYTTILEVITRLRRFWMTCVRALKRAWNFEGNRSWGEYLYVLTCYWTKRPYTPSVVRTPIPRNRGWTRYPLRHDRSQHSWSSNGVLNVYVRFFDIRIIRTPQTGFEPAVRKTTCDPDVIWTRNLLNWSQTRYLCATRPVVYRKNCYSTIFSCRLGSVRNMVRSKICANQGNRSIDTDPYQEKTNFPHFSPEFLRNKFENFFKNSYRTIVLTNSSKEVPKFFIKGENYKQTTEKLFSFPVFP